ncbi:exodeoxyribonuclease III (plasmid) [Rhodococcus opacus]|uniref:Exodeoxyribonuclease III n=1 Tax=Rhodococcus opacus TaxID=37919 RepID=A0A1B1KHD0_RHOOP|nr:exodeoxyribonuclease III [Rhodococcus opacus]ANS32022.1 exodeoxyribonuclease III [Rhodococcus opacus]
MKIVSWNVNSVRTRLPRIEALLARHTPDLLCLQELKTGETTFPAEELAASGYHAVIHGQPGRNGVAMVARAPLADITRGFTGDPVPDQARVLSASVGTLRIVTVYVVNGQSTHSREYAVKLRWLDSFTRWLRATNQPSDPLLVVGDFNIAPDDRDVYAPDTWRGQNLCSDSERRHLKNLTTWGLIDLTRLHHPGPGPYTFWDYRQGAFHRGWGWRIDLALATAPVAERCTDVQVDRDERKPSFGEGKPSDHAPLVITEAAPTEWAPRPQPG